tara:strand:- start:1131 stop:4229 length:3099 start_codon:yes stop_codon:yes gene_type:complete
LEALVEKSSKDRLGEMLLSSERFGRTQSNLTLLSTPTTPILGSPSGRPFFLTGFEEHSTLTQGRWPVSRSLQDLADDQAIEIVLGFESSRQLSYLVGDEIFLVPSHASSDRIPFEVVGVANPIDADEEYWMDNTGYFELASVGESVVVPIYMTEDDFFQGIGARYTTLVGDFGFFLFLDAGYLTVGNAKEVKQQIVGLETDLNKKYPRTLVLTRLGLTVEEFDRALTLARIPLLLYLSLVVVVVLYFLALITGTLGRSQAEEAGLLRSRGASVFQVSGVLAMAEAAVVLAAIVVGPFLAWAIVKTLLLDTINPGGEFSTGIPLGLSGDMFWMGALGGGMALVVLLATAAGRARMGTLETLLSRTRPPTIPFLHRYYLDILAVLTVAVIWFQVRGRDGFVAEGLASKGISVDPTLVIGPVMGLFAAAVLLLRVLPLVVRFLAWAGTRIGAAWFQFSLVRLARDPIPHGSLAVILMLAAALGVFGATFQSSLSQGQSDQARYKIGGNMVLRGPALHDDSPEKLRKIPGVTAVSAILRDSVTLVDSALGQSVDMLAVDPHSLEKTAFFRDDFYPGGLPGFSKELRPRPFSGSFSGAGVLLPEDTVSLGVWVNSDALIEKNLQFGVNMWARLATAKGRYRTIPMGNVMERDGSDATDVIAVDGDWRLFSADLTALGWAEPPFELVSVFFSTTPTNRLSDGVIHLDDITAFGPSSGPQGVIIEGFEGSTPWEPLANQGADPDLAERARSSARSGGSGLRFSWTVSIADGQRGVLLPAGPSPLPAIGGPEFQVGQQVRVELGNLVVPVRFVGITTHFPTLIPDRKPFFIVDLTDFQEYARRLPSSISDEPNEMWLALDEDADRSQVILQIAEAAPGLITVRDGEATAALAERNPLAGGGWDGLTIFSMAAIGIAVLLTLTVHSLVSIRTGRMDLAVARVLGFSSRQFFLSLAAERMIIAVLAIAAGAAMGYWPGLEILELVDLTPQGDAPVPPLLPSVKGWLMAGVLGGLLGAAILSVGFAVVAARRLNTAEVLRGGI